MGSVVGLEGARGAGLVDLGAHARPVFDSSARFGRWP
jgi:hypothetical protein